MNREAVAGELVKIAKMLSARNDGILEAWFKASAVSPSDIRRLESKMQMLVKRAGGNGSAKGYVNDAGMWVISFDIPFEMTVELRDAFRKLPEWRAAARAGGMVKPVI